MFKFKSISLSLIDIESSKEEAETPQKESRPSTASTPQKSQTSELSNIQSKVEMKAAVPAPQVESNQLVITKQGGPAAPGLFLMKIIESRSLVHPNGTRILPGGPSGKDETELPFAVIEMDKNEVLMRAVEGVPATGNGIWGTRAHL